MTREEAKQEFWQVSKSSGYTGVFERAFNIKFNDVLKMPYHGSEFDKFIDKIYDDFEARIAELESPKKSKHEILCTGCKYEYISYGSFHCQKDYECFRGCHTFSDFYEERESDQ
jgi:hypothetical protein